MFLLVMPEVFGVTVVALVEHIAVLAILITASVFSAHTSRQLELFGMSSISHYDVRANRQSRCFCW
jgi:hypothetical protein